MQKPRENSKIKKLKENGNNSNVKENIDVDAILSVKKYKKKALSFYQDKSVSEALSSKAESSNKRVSEALGLILENIIDVEKGICKIDIEEKKEEKIPNTFKIDERILEVLKKEADIRNMSVNEYLNKVLKVVLKIN